MKVKLLRDVKFPSRQRSGDAGVDLYCPCDVKLFANKLTQVKLGIAIELAQDEVGMIQERSGVALKYNLHTIGNIIDSNYRGEISMMVQNNTDHDIMFGEGDRVAQLLILKLGDQNIYQVDELSETTRGDLNHGSSGV